MALMTCRSCGHYYVTVEKQGQQPSPPCYECRRSAPVAGFRRYLRGYIRFGTARERKRAAAG
jgi:hypothetical protein